MPPPSVLADIRRPSTAALEEQCASLQQQLVWTSKLEQAKLRREQQVQGKAAAAAAFTTLPLASPKRLTASAAFPYAAENHLVCRAVDEDWGRKCTAQKAQEAADFREQLQRHQAELKHARKRAAEQEQHLSQLSMQRDAELQRHQESAKCQLEQKVKWAHCNNLHHLEQSQQLLAATCSKRAERLQGWSEKQRMLNEQSASARQRCAEEREERVVGNHVVQEEGRRAGNWGKAEQLRQTCCRLDAAAKARANVQGRHAEESAEEAARREHFGRTLNFVVGAKAEAAMQQRQLQAARKKAASEERTAAVQMKRQQREGRLAEQVAIKVGHKWSAVLGITRGRCTAEHGRELAMQEQWRKQVIAAHWAEDLKRETQRSMEVPAVRPSVLLSLGVAGCP